MVSNKYLWHRFRNNKENFNLYKELFIAERGPLIVVLAASILIGVLALFGAYFQRYLFSQIIDDTFPTSGWVYFGLISGSAILRFFLFNVNLIKIEVGSEYCKLVSNKLSMLYLECAHKAYILPTRKDGRR